MLSACALPPVDALVIGGGFPETQLRALEANGPLRRDVKAAIEAGLPAYAECGGLMYLARSIAWRGEAARMVGVIPGDVVMHDRPVGRGYARLAATGPAAWLGALPGEEFAAHEFHYSSLENVAAGTSFAFRVTRGHGIDGARDGIVIGNLLASYCHLRGAGERGWARALVRAARRRMSESSGTARARAA
jgi:cobyrinic acid a,c-diamide synthase